MTSSEIPSFIHSFSLGYRFYLDHYTIHSEETVLCREIYAPEP